jgi:DNA-binding transcriptional regulator YdaS (Cro superfamily)
MNPFDALKIEFGTLTQLASLLRMKETALYQWVKRGQIPIKHVKKIELLSQGRLTAEVLRPDLFEEKV